MERIQKVVRQQRQLKLNGISIGNSRMAKLLPAKLVRDLWKMEFKDMESTLRDMEVDVAMEVARELGSTERMNSQANGSGSWIWERKSENEKSCKLF